MDMFQMHEETRKAETEWIFGWLYFALRSVY